jgi:hypothetical protein
MVFIMIDAVAATYAFENDLLLMVTLWRDQDGYRLADDLLSEVAEESLCTLVPACDDAINVLTDYRVITELDNGSEPPEPLPTFAQLLLDLVALNQVRGLSGKHVQWLQLAFRGVMRLSPVGRNHPQ